MRIIVAGDFVPKNRVLELINKNEYGAVFDSIKPLFDDADYSILNLECPISQAVENIPIIKIGPNLKCSSSAVGALKYLGINAVTLANNHILDYGPEALKTTIQLLRTNSIDYVGAGMSLDTATAILYPSVLNKSISIINVCEREFSIATRDSAGAAPLDLIDLSRRIAEAKNTAEYLLLIIHGGSEMYALPSPRMKKVYRWLIDQGADAVFNHHQHCYSGYEIYCGKPIVYGMGNFCFDSPSKAEAWYTGYLAELIIDNGIRLKIHPYSQCFREARVTPMSKEGIEQFDTQIKRLNAIIQDDLQLESCFHEFCTTQRQYMLSLLSPYSNKYVLELCERGLLPSFINETRICRLLDYLSCESHKDVLENCLIESLK